MSKYPALAIIFALSIFAQEDSERAVQLQHITAPQAMNELAVIVKVMTDMMMVKADHEQHTLTFRGSAAQGALADWLIAGLEGRTTGRGPFTTALDREENTVKMFHLKNTKTVQGLQQLATLVRSISGVRRLMTYAPEPTLTIRTTAQQSALAEWLVTWLDQPLISRPEYRVPGGADDLVRLFPVPKAPEALHQLATRIRQETKVTRIFTYDLGGAIAVRGTAAQLDQASALITR
ncbi:MAG: hypothetical protein K2X03_31590 [Bryobacteraceae bacterium]|nr:hypothetical protein [Bryobacteraceae bacterium]